MGANLGYIANFYVISNSYSNGRTDGRSRSNEQMVIIDGWMPSWGYQETTTNDTSSSRIYKSIGGSNYIYVANRHNGSINYLRKDGGVHATLPGARRYGADPIWIVYNDGTCWKDGVIN
jgi:hypothetical protein